MNHSFKVMEMRNWLCSVDDIIPVIRRFESLERLYVRIGRRDFGILKKMLDEGEGNCESMELVYNKWNISRSIPRSAWNFTSDDTDVYVYEVLLTRQKSA